MNIDDNVDSLFTALWYDYSKEYIIETITDVEYMIVNHGTRKCTEMASYIFKVLVLRYGDYGVAPAVGWIFDELKDSLLGAINNWCNDMHIYESEDKE